MSHSATEYNYYPVVIIASFPPAWQKIPRCVETVNIALKVYSCKKLHEFYAGQNVDFCPQRYTQTLLEFFLNNFNIPPDVIQLRAIEDVGNECPNDPF